MAGKQRTHVSESKKESVKELSKLIKDKKTILVASIKNIPASQFQEIGKKLRSKAIIRVPKKSLIFRALESSGNSEIEKLKEQVKDNTAVLFSDLDAFELSSELVENKRPVKAKVGQEAPENIEIPAGPTDLVPGPAISELGALGIKIQIEGGKITIKEPKVIVKRGEKISENAASMMNKLDIKPFSISFIPLASFDKKEGKLYLNIRIDREGTLKELKSLFSKALGFAVEIDYVCKDTIRFFLSKAAAQANKINRIMTGEPEPVAGEKAEEVMKENKETKEEPKADSTAGLASLFG